MPSELPSTESNFRKEASNYTLDSNNALVRNDKLVVKYSQRNEIYQAYHRPAHSGKST